MKELKECPCGKTPKNLCITEGSSSSWGYVGGGCCGEWELEFRRGYEDVNSAVCMDKAVERWNEAKRK